MPGPPAPNRTGRTPRVPDPTRPPPARLSIDAGNLGNACSQLASLLKEVDQAYRKGQLNRGQANTIETTSLRVSSVIGC